MIRSIDAQITKMSEQCPQFEVQDRDKNCVKWVGTLTPQRKKYTLAVFYKKPLVIENFELVEVQPRVQVLDPVLERHPEYEEGPIPHVYTSSLTPSFPYLCLFDPHMSEWSPSDWISETTVPWASRWLSFYEAWLAIGKWKGGGRHPDGETIREEAA